MQMCYTVFHMSFRKIMWLLMNLMTVPDVMVMVPDIRVMVPEVRVMVPDVMVMVPDVR